MSPSLSRNCKARYIAQKCLFARGGVLFYFLVVLTIFSALASAKDYDLGQVIVRSNKTQNTWIDSSSSAQIISGQALETSKDFLQILRSNGIEVTQSGINGNSSIYLRSFSGKYTIVMIDGIPINDISNPNGEFNAAYLRNLNIERIEILKGAQSVLHGGALAGIVNIITKKTVKKNSIYSTIGSYDYFNSGVSYFNELDNVVYHLVGDFETRSGPSEAKSGSEDDQYKNTNGLVSLNYQLGSKVIAKSHIQYTKTAQDFDATGAVPKDSLENHLTSSMLLGIQSFDFHINDKFFSEVDLSILKNTRSYFGDWVSDWDGRQLRIESRNQYKLKNLNILLGLTHTNDKVDSNTFTKKLSQTDLFFKNEFSFRPFKFELGLRSVQHQTYNTKNLYQSALSTQISDWNMALNWGTSFRAPSISELHDPSTGNANLKPESASSWELNFKRQRVNDSVQLSFFKQEIKDQIIYISSLINQGEYQVSGIELELTNRFQKNELNFITSYNNLEYSKRAQALRVAYFQTALNFTHELNDENNFIFTHRYKGDRRDKSDGSIVKLKDYHLVDFSWMHNFKNYSLRLAVNNLFDQSYEEIYGYQTLKRNYFLSLTKDF